MTDTKTGPERLYWIDQLRVLACFAVVLLHVSGVAVVEAKFASIDWHIGNLLDSATRWSVPVFVLISGIAYFIFMAFWLEVYLFLSQL